MADVRQENGSRGGEYWIVDLGGSWIMGTSRKAGDDRVWIGREGEPSSFDQQRGGVTTLAKMREAVDALYVQSMVDKWKAHEMGAEVVDVSEQTV